MQACERGVEASKPHLDPAALRSADARVIDAAAAVHPPHGVKASTCCSTRGFARPTISCCCAPKSASPIRSSRVVDPDSSTAAGRARGARASPAPEPPLSADGAPAPPGRRRRRRRRGGGIARLSPAPRIHRDGGADLNTFWRPAMWRSRSNMNQPRDRIADACTHLAALCETRLEAFSPLYRARPMGRRINRTSSTQRLVF